MSVDPFCNQLLLYDDIHIRKIGVDFTFGLSAILDFCYKNYGDCVSTGVRYIKVLFHTVNLL